MSVLKIRNTLGEWEEVLTLKGDKGDKGNGISSAVLNSDYTLTLTFTDGTTYTTPSIRGEKGEQGDPATSMEIHICSSSEYDSQTRIPTIAQPDNKTFYLVPTSDATSPDLFTEWVYVNNAWEKFGSAAIALKNIKDDPVGVGAVIEGHLVSNYATGNYAHASGTDTTASGNNSHAEGGGTTASGSESHAEGSGTLASGVGSHAEGAGTQATAAQSHAEGGGSVASGASSHAEGGGTTASAQNAHAEGGGTTASGVGSHAEGNGTRATAIYSHAEGQNTLAGGVNAHAEGTDTQANGMSSHAEGTSTIAQRKSQLVIGECNTPDTGGSNNTTKGNYIFIAGNGSNTQQRSNAMTLDWNGNEKLSGGLTLGTGTNDETSLSASELKAMKALDPVEDVQINGTSIVANGVANVPIATASSVGVVRTSTDMGTQMSGNILGLKVAESSDIKTGTNAYRPIVPGTQHESTFYGLAKAAGDTSQSQSANPVGQYTDDAKDAIRDMIGAAPDEEVNELETAVDDKAPVIIESASGDIVSFEDGADGMPLKSLVVDIEPVQDLHGQSSPYPAGGGKNIMPAPISFEVNSSGLTVTDDNGRMTINGSVQSGDSIIFHVPEITISTGYIIALLNSFTGATIYFLNGAVNVDYFSLSTVNRVVNASSMVTLYDKPFNAYRILFSVAQTFSNASVGMMVVQDGADTTAFSPYENICPISGWTGATVSRTGKNLLDLSNLRQGNYSVATNSRNVSFDEHQPIKGGQTYVWSSSLNDIAGRYLKFYDADKIELSGEVSLYGVGAKTFSVPSNARYFRCMWYRGTGIEPTDIVADQIELGSTATDYSPYNGNAYTVDWTDEAGTVYGGKLDVVSGELTVDRIVEHPTSVTGSQIDTYGRCYIYTTGQVALKKELYALAMCDMLASTTNATATFAVSQYGGAGAIYFISLDSTYDTVAKYNAWLMENKPTIVLWLDEPITYQLTPTEVNSLLGQNNIYANTGNTSVEYRADTEMYINKVKPVVNVDDVQINGTSIVNDGVASVPVADANNVGLMRVGYGLFYDNTDNRTNVSFASANAIKDGINGVSALNPVRQHQSVFYGLAKAAGADEKDSTLAVGNYTDNAKDKIQTMLGVSPLIAPHESDPFESNHAVGELFIIGGKLYRAKTALTAGEYINEGTNVEVVDVAEVLDDYATKQEIENNINIVEKNNSGSIVSFGDGADGMPMKSLIVSIDPVQSGSGDPSPDNVRPISGWTEVGVEQSGVNIWDEEWELGYYKDDGTKGESNGNICCSNKIPVLPNTTYYAKTPYTYGIRLYEFDASGSFRLIGYKNNQTFITSNSARYIVFYTNAADYVTSYDGGLSINYPSSDHSYHPYTGRSIAIDWQTEAGTVYGGTLDIVSGVLTVDRAMVDLGTLDWSYNSVNQRFLAVLATKATTWVLPNALCSTYPTAIWGQAQGDMTKDKMVFMNGSYVSVRDTDYTDAASFKTAMDGVQLVYELAEPIVYHLNPTEVQSLLGTNNIWADSGDVSVEYFSQVDEDLVDYIKANLNSYAKKDLLNNYVRNTDYATSSTAGVVKTDSDWGIGMYDPAWSGGEYGNFLYISPASSAQIKAGSTSYKAVVPNTQHESVFYGLAKSAGDTTQSASSNAVGNYTESAKSAISEMLGGSVSVSGTTPTIVAKSGIRYVCGEVATLDFTPSATGICDVVFTSGSTATVLTVPNTIKWANGFDPTALEANTTYEINIMDGLGVACAWT